MKAYLLDIVPSIKAYSKALDKRTIITNQYWLSFNDTSIDTKTSFIFKKDNSLLISENGAVEKGKWELVGNNKILIETPKFGSNLLVHEYLDDKFLILSQDSHSKAYYVFLNEDRINHETVSLKGVENYLNALSNTNVSRTEARNETSTETEDDDSNDIGGVVIYFTAFTLLIILVLIVALNR